MNIDYDKLRRDLAEHYGKKLRFNPCEIFNVNKVQNATEFELKNMAIRNGFKLSDYNVVVKRYS